MGAAHDQTPGSEGRIILVQLSVGLAAFLWFLMGAFVVWAIAPSWDPNAERWWGGITGAGRIYFKITDGTVSLISIGTLAE